MWATVESLGAMRHRDLLKQKPSSGLLASIGLFATMCPVGSVGMSSFNFVATVLNGEKGRLFFSFRSESVFALNGGVQVYF